MNAILPGTPASQSNFVIPAKAGTHGRDISGSIRTGSTVDRGFRRDDGGKIKLLARNNAQSDTPDPKLAKVAQQFEALFVGQMLKSARAAALADNPLEGPAGATFRDFQDEQRAQALAKAAPLGVARLLASHR